MARTIEVTLPDFYTISSAKDAPEEYRTVSTKNWTADTVLNAVEFGLSESMGNTWSVGKKDVPTFKARHEAIERGEWARRGGGKGANLDTLAAKMTAEDLQKWFEAAMAAKKGK